MPIIRNTDQGIETLEEFYQNLKSVSTNNYTQIADKMLDLLPLLETCFKSFSVWGLTSMARLVLQNRDDWKTDWYVIIGNIGMADYYIDYKLPASKQPWENARVSGQAGSLVEAMKYILVAMRESEGWIGNEELAKACKEHGV